jgi:hypothetical protein
MCGSTTCTAGQICLVNKAGVSQESCVADPCAPHPLSCSCAGTLCVGADNMCSVNGGKLQCACALCP